VAYFIITIPPVLQIDGAWRTEIVRDPAVITAYVRSRQLLEEEATNADTLAPTGDADKDMRAKRRYVEKSIHLDFSEMMFIC